MKITFEYDESEKEAVDQFMSWLCEQGEQDYWIWMEEREQETNKDITVTKFHYDFNALDVACEVGRMSEPYKEEE